MTTGNTELTVEEQAAAAEQAEREAAIAIGDIIEEEKPVELDAEVLKDIAKDDVAPDVTTPEKKDEYMIPKARLDELSSENKALKERLQALEASQVTKPEVEDVYSQLETKRDELSAKADELLVEGDITARQAVLKEIRLLDKQIYKAEIQSELAQEKNTSTLNEVVSWAEKTYTFLNPESETYDADAVALINARQSSLMQAGQSPALALHNAIQEKAEKLVLLFGGQTTQDDPNADAKNSAAELKAAREKAAREKAASASVNQPAGLPLQTDKDKLILNTATMTAKQILALPEAERAKLMGDAI